ncbi:MAG: hypothetical protein F4210_07925 [Holophagales bacterium]|nr:hypothetical protein [Holophagales bacterium]MYF95425.1 hypothetical protein [Holophagales bacterium]
MASEGVAVSSASVEGLRSRLATIDLEALEQARAAVSGAEVPEWTLALNLFDDVVLTGVVDSTASTFSGGFSLSGRLLGVPLGSVTIVVNGERVAGAVRAPEGSYSIRTAGNGLYAVSEMPPVALECEAEQLHLEAENPHR